MKFSLVTATVDRTSELLGLCESLAAQIHRDFELIVVDQNPDDRLAPILAEYGTRMSIVHLRSARGLSRARNAGIRAATGDVVAFPDDDCAYPADLLANINQTFENRPDLDGLTCAAWTETRGFHRRWHRQGGPLTRYNLFQRSVSYSIFMRRQAAELLDFDEALGPGSGRTPWLGGEEHEFLIRALLKGRSIWYFPEFGVIHPDRPPRADPVHFRRRYGESMGLTFFLRKYKYPAWFAGYMVLLSTGGMILSLLRADPIRVRSYYAALTGKLRGWREAAL